MCAERLLSLLSFLFVVCVVYKNVKRYLLWSQNLHIHLCWVKLRGTFKKDGEEKWIFCDFSIFLDIKFLIKKWAKNNSKKYSHPLTMILKKINVDEREMLRWESVAKKKHLDVSTETLLLVFIASFYIHTCNISLVLYL
jgi:hypothetical protein